MVQGRDVPNFGPIIKKFDINSCTILGVVKYFLISLIACNALFAPLIAQETWELHWSFESKVMPSTLISFLDVIKLLLIRPCCNFDEKYFEVWVANYCESFISLSKSSIQKDFEITLSKLLNVLIFEMPRILITLSKPYLNYGVPTLKACGGPLKC